MMTNDDQQAFEELERRLKTLLPEDYRDRYDEVQPVSMGSAGLKYAPDGQVAWDEIWSSFCDLAMAGGPPHKGSLLEPASPSDIDNDRTGYDTVVAEICRGITLVTELETRAAPAPGWVQVECLTRGMASWLQRAITMENVAVRADGVLLHLPAGPGFRVEKEIKNVITAIAKTTHYWLGHMSVMQRRSVAGILHVLDVDSPLIEPVYQAGDETLNAQAALAATVSASVERETGLRSSDRRYASWVGFECPSARAAVWMMRMMVGTNVLARREATALFIPINPSLDPDGTVAGGSLSLVHRFAREHGIA